MAPKMRMCQKTKKSLTGASKRTLQTEENRVAAGKHVVQQQLQALRAREDEIKKETEFDRTVMEIVEELYKSPAKAKACKDAVLSKMFLEDEEEEEILHETLRFLKRVPQDWIHECMGRFDTKWRIQDFVPELKRTIKKQRIMNMAFSWATLTHKEI